MLSRKISRLDFIKNLSLLSGLLVAGCTPLRILLKQFPEEFKTNNELIDTMLRAFVVTVIPGAPFDDPNLTRIYTDDFYPFHSYCGFFVSDPSKRSEELYGTERFEQLAFDQRTKVIQGGLQADATLARLYAGAIFMAQASFYGGIYDDEKGCPLIDFHGTNSGFSADEMFYPDGRSFLACEVTQTGNYI
ncbi:MAG: hypothetical protein HY033_08920 [Ignavibacteriae bacterium]|nr:hypothetical protein [Ignavibacteria bacterium]MBI3365013.1 hypothetical protein [Ignavibacteriota bacterium]